MRRGLLVAAGLLLPAVVQAATLRVPEEYGTIQAAVDVSAAGDTVLVGPGEWTSTSQRFFRVNGVGQIGESVLFTKPGIVVIGREGASATMLGSPTVPAISGTVVHANDGGATTTLQGLTIVGGEYNAITGGSETESGTSNLLTVEECTVVASQGLATIFYRGQLRFSRSEITGSDGSGLVGAVYGWNTTLEIVDCEVSSNLGQAIEVENSDVPGSVKLVRSTFRDQTGRAVRIEDAGYVEVTECWFDSNAGGGLALTDIGSGAVHRNTFSNNSSSSGAGLWMVFAPVEARWNTFYNCSSSITGNAIQISGEDGGVSNNIIAHCGGGQGAVVLFGGPSNSTTGCNLFWENEGGDYFLDWSPPSTDIVADPQFCDVTDNDFHVAASSICLPENNFAECAELIGAFGAGCPSTGVYPVGFRTTPDDLPVIVDGVVRQTPWVETWPVGSVHEISVPVSPILPIPEARYTFQSWSDGGAETHEITVADSFREFTASFLAEYYVAAEAEEGGTAGPSAWVIRDEPHEVLAVPDSAWTFVRWIGEGEGANSSTDNPTIVRPTGPIVQTARFHNEAPLLTMDVIGGGSVFPETSRQTLLTDVTIAAVPALGWEFAYWLGTGVGSYSGGNNPATVTMNEPITQTATFVVGELPLTMLAEQGGTVTPEGGDVTSFTDVEIEAIPDPGHRFVQWKGEGDGSYTGPDNPATVTLNGPITQVAHFEPAAYSVTLSLSDTDPHVHTGGAVGLGNLHLWVTCGSTEHGLQSVRLETTGSVQPLAFLPAPGASASGAGTVLAGIDGCPDGPVRLGSFLVNAPGEGSLCLDAAGAVSGLTVTDCRGARYSWPENVGFVGVHTGGGQPCGGGSGCEAIDAFAAPVGAPDVAAPPSATRLAGIFPNPFGDGTTIEFEVARPMEVRLAVFDVSGRQVKVLRDGNVPSGRHSVGWDGRDSGGQAVAGGVYFVRLTADGVERTEKVTVVRGRP